MHYITHYFALLNVHYTLHYFGKCNALQGITAGLRRPSMLYTRYFGFGCEFRLAMHPDGHDFLCNIFLLKKQISVGNKHIRMQDICRT